MHANSHESCHIAYVAAVRQNYSPLSFFHHNLNDHSLSDHRLNGHGSSDHSVNGHGSSDHGLNGRGLNSNDLNDSCLLQFCLFLAALLISLVYHEY